ncbi:MAG: hypothetical protein GY906_30390 [bacterium]|nr:hypothetical protein [bacterium]
MNSITQSRSVHVLLAAAIVIVLAGVLGVRIFATTVSAGPAGVPDPGPAFVPQPSTLVIADLKVPKWGKIDPAKTSIDYQTDLDLLAPLGNGELNAALWFKDFTKEPAGSRLQESSEANKVKVKASVEWLDKVYPLDLPLVTEAEPWCDQATMSFYSEFLQPDGWKTPIPNLLVPLNLARTWVARGLVSNDPEAAMADFRRAIRLGRLLRQEGIVIITDLVGMACIDAGARGIFELAKQQGDLELALLAAIVIGEHAPQRFVTRQLVVDPDEFDVARREDGAGFTFQITNGSVDTLVERAQSYLDARFRNESIIFLAMVRQFGTQEQQTKVVEALNGLLASDEPGIAENARWALECVTDDEELADLFEVK